MVLFVLLVSSPLALPIFGQVEWTASDENPVFLPGDPGTWDSAAVYATWLMERDGEYKLWYGGTRFGDFVGIIGVEFFTGCAISNDLIHWKRILDNPCLPGSRGEWDENTGAASVIYKKTTDDDPAPYKMWYGGDRDNFFFTNQMSIGYATSSDGFQWTKHAGNPVLRPSGPGTWESHSITFPSVLFDEEKRIFRMWYTGVDWNDCGSPKTGYAESEDGINWVKYPFNPILIPDDSELSGGVYWARVLFDRDTKCFELWYSGYCSGNVSYATSLDGITWCKYPGNPSPIEGEIVGSGYGNVLRVGNEYHMIYNRWDGDLLGYATSPWNLPKASFTVTPESGPAPLVVTLDASLSATPAALIVDDYWDFGDGAASEGPQVEHAYTEPGNYLLKLTVTDSAGKEGSMARRILVAPPVLGRQIPGDCNQDNAVDITDAVCLLGTLFLGQPVRFPCGDGSPAHAANRSLLDWQPDGAVDISDAVSLLQFLFLGGPRHPLAVPGNETTGCTAIANCPNQCP